MTATKAINQWSCALACLESTLNKHGNPITQNNIIKAYRPFFHAWQNNQEGLLSRIEIVYLLELLGYHFSDIIYTNDKGLFISVFTTHIKSGRYWASFLVLHQPTNHCNAIVGMCGEELTVMEPDQNTPKIDKMTFAEAQKRDAEYILLCI